MRATRCEVKKLGRVVGAALLVLHCAREPDRATGPAQHPSALAHEPASADVMPPRPAPAQPPPLAAIALELPPHERARLSALFEVWQLVQREWPPLEAAEPCVLLLTPAMQWVVNCNEAPAGFSDNTQRFRGRAVYAHRAGSFRGADGRELSTEQLLSRMPAAAHLDAPGTRSSDLPAGHAWLVLGSLEALIANHPAFRAATTEEWLSVALHELFHTLQLGASAFAPYLALVNRQNVEAKPLAELYRTDKSYRTRVEREYDTLVLAARKPELDAEHARKILQQWLTLSRRRRAVLDARPNGAQLVQSELLLTYVEGTARYVESKFLVEPSQHAPQSIAGDEAFHRYERFSGRGYPGMPNRQLDDEYYYAIGFHLSLLLDRVDPSWKRCVQREPGWLVGLAERVVSSASAPACP